MSMTDEQKIDEYIDAQGDWQKRNLVAFRALVHETIPGVQETWKWMVPVFLSDGKLICAMSVFKGHTKFNFFEGASLDDSLHVFNNGFDSKKHRSIDMSESDELNHDGIAALLEQV